MQAVALALNLKHKFTINYTDNQSLRSVIGYNNRCCHHSGIVVIFLVLLSESLIYSNLLRIELVMQCLYASRTGLSSLVKSDAFYVAQSELDSLDLPPRTRPRQPVSSLEEVEGVVLTTRLVEGNGLYFSFSLLL